MIKQSKVTSDGTVKVTFTLPSDHSLGPTSVVGEFNNWDPYSNPLKKRSNKSYSTTIEVLPGQRYRFRYLAENGQWFDELEVTEFETNTFGDQDGILNT